jgi:hypothetical protein
MKKNCIILIALLFFSMHKSRGQASTLGNSGSGTNYLGWNNLMSGTSLKIKTTTDDPITFHTNTVTNTSFGKIRMQISNTTVNAPNGASFEVGRVQIRENPLNAGSTAKN